MMRIEGIYGEWFDRVYVNGRLLDPKSSQKVYNHSPDGFAWGYSGSGPSQLALAILLKAGLPNDQAVQLHHAFKQEFIAGLPARRDFELELDVKKWAAHKLDQTRDHRETV